MTRHTPVHVTLRVREGIWNLRTRRAFRVLFGAFQEGRERMGGRLVHYSAQTNHLHLIVEAVDARALARFMAGLKIRIARRMNRAMGRHGAVFADRFHARVLRTPAEVRAALCYVLNNDLHHGAGARRFDAFSSAPWFDGWQEGEVRWAKAYLGPAPCVAARAWLLTTGWRRRGLIGLDETPG